MGILTTVKMSLFDAPEGSILIHAANSQGVWGSGIAKEMKERFPLAFRRYNAQCSTYLMTGQYDLTFDKTHHIASIVTSNNYGEKVDSPEEILVNTTIAIYELLKYADKKLPIYSNKFNSGLFRVPWFKTEEIIKVFVKQYDLNWVVCEL
jgi:ADP-ribose 1''-phosphate phosphatase